MVVVIDFGGATYNWDRHKSRVVNTRQYRSPEVVMQVQAVLTGDCKGRGSGGSSSSYREGSDREEAEPAWDCASDVWSAGCIIAETYTGELLFATVSVHNACIPECECVKGYNECTVTYM
jgi:serine/threonine protein kinase